MSSNSWVENWQHQVAHAKQIGQLHAKEYQDALARMDRNLQPGTAAALEKFVELNDFLTHAEALQPEELKELVDDLNDLGGWIISNDAPESLREIKMIRMEQRKAGGYLQVAHTSSRKSVINLLGGQAKGGPMVNNQTVRPRK